MGKKIKLTPEQLDAIKQELEKLDLLEQENVRLKSALSQRQQVSAPQMDTPQKYYDTSKSDEEKDVKIETEGRSRKTKKHKPGDEVEKLLDSFDVFDYVSSLSVQIIHETWVKFKKIFFYELTAIIIITIALMAVGTVYYAAGGKPSETFLDMFKPALTVLEWGYLKPYSLLIIFALFIIPVRVIRKEKKDVQKMMIGDVKLGGFTAKFQKQSDEKMQKLREVILTSCRENSYFFILEMINKGLRIFFYYIAEIILLIYFLIYAAPLVIAKIPCNILIIIICSVMFVINLLLFSYSTKRLISNAGRQNLKSSVLGMARYEQAFPTPMDVVGPHGRYGY